MSSVKMLSFGKVNFFVRQSGRRTKLDRMSCPNRHML